METYAIEGFKESVFSICPKLSSQAWEYLEVNLEAVLKPMVVF